MRRWQFDVLFAIAALGAVFLLLAPVFHLDISVTSNPTALTGYTAILAYVLTQRGSWTDKKKPPEVEPPKSEATKEGDS